MANDVSQACMLLWRMDGSDCAAWVQAWGTILAVVGAGLAAWWQVHHQSRKEAERQASTFGARVALIGLATLHAEALLIRHRGDSKRDMYNVHTTYIELNEVLAGALAVKFEEMPTPAAVNALLAWRLAAQEWQLTMQRNQQTQWLIDAEMERWQAKTGEANRHWQRLQAELKAIDPATAKKAAKAATVQTS